MSARPKLHVAIGARCGNHSHMNWPHGPAHWLFEQGLYIITAATYRKLPHLNSPARLDFFQNSLFQHPDEFGWDLRAWAVLANHYHFAPPAFAKSVGSFRIDQINVPDDF
jgi:hypothetical protein